MRDGVEADRRKEERYRSKQSEQRGILAEPPVVAHCRHQLAQRRRTDPDRKVGINSVDLTPKYCREAADGSGSAHDHPHCAPRLLAVRAVHHRILNLAIGGVLRDVRDDGDDRQPRGRSCSVEQADTLADRILSRLVHVRKRLIDDRGRRTRDTVDVAEVTARDHRDPERVEVLRAYRQHRHGGPTLVIDWRIASDFVRHAPHAGCRQLGRDCDSRDARRDFKTSPQPRKERNLGRRVPIAILRQAQEH
jgi:hypothetical protein